MTALVDVEALINSRLLTHQSASPEDNIPLTPNHRLHVNWEEIRSRGTK